MYRYLFVFMLGSAACLPEVEETCEEIATQQCELCFTCSSDFDGQQLCQAGGTKQACVSALTDRCQTQAATVQEPKDALSKCLDDVNGYQCEQVLRDHVSGARPIPAQCDYYL